MTDVQALRRELGLPALPLGRSWQLREFLNNELQAHEPGTRVVLAVRRSVRLLGLALSWRDASYPAYVIDVRKEAAYFEETARLMLSQHEEYVRNHNERAL